MLHPRAKGILAKLVSQLRTRDALEQSFKLGRPELHYVRRPTPPSKVIFVSLPFCRCGGWLRFRNDTEHRLLLLQQRARVRLALVAKFFESEEITLFKERPGER